MSRRSRILILLAMLALAALAALAAVSAGTGLVTGGDAGGPAQPPPASQPPASQPPASQPPVSSPPAPQPPPPKPPGSGPSLGKLIGQKLVVRMDGTTPSASLLARARLGQIGGVIVYGRNFSTPTQLRTIAARLQAAAEAGGQPRLLIAVDQEGGDIKALPSAPPSLSPPQMGSSGSAATALAQGQETGNALHALGVNVDFAPVADVPASKSSFMYLEGRTWSFSATTTARLSTAFAKGLLDWRVTPTMKHFPGLGWAPHNTDFSIVRIMASPAQLAPGLVPYQAAVSARLPLVMLSNAVYTAYDRWNAAGWSKAISIGLLRDQLGFQGVTITDSLDGAAHARHITPNSLAVRAANAGTDMILTTGSEPTTRSEYASLLDAARSGSIDRTRLLASYRRIITLKSSLG